MRMRRPILTSIAAVVVLLHEGPALAQDNAADATRLIDVLRVLPGQVLADIGAGPGALLTIPMARTVGPAGKVYATDIGDMVGRVRASITKAGLDNVEVVEGPAREHEPPCRLLRRHFHS